MTTTDDNTPPAGTDPNAGAQADSANSEAAKWRRQLREVEAERDALRERVNAQARTQVEDRLADRLNRPADLWLVTELDTVLTEAGDIDDDKLEAAVAAAVEERPHWATRPTTPPSPKPNAALSDTASGGNNPGDNPAEPSWGDALRR